MLTHWKDSSSNNVTDLPNTDDLKEQVARESRSEHLKTMSMIEPC
jgi:hypothetical protein